jgi:hypothetical protein
MIVHGEVMAGRTPRHPSYMTDEQWALIEPLLPAHDKTIEAPYAN